jgi:hypothetical protein
MNPWLLKNTSPAFDVLFACRGKVRPVSGGPPDSTDKRFKK